MTIYEKKEYQDTLEKILMQLEQLAMDILLAGVERLNNSYNHANEALNQKNENDMRF